MNDNSPEFESSTVRISVPENVETGTPLYAAHARDRDSGSNGVIRYKIANAASNGGLFEVDTKTGHLTLKRHLDYEIAQRHSLIITATDTGIPPLSANLTILVEVQDVNDNPPVFEQAEYSVKVLETLPVNWQVSRLPSAGDTQRSAQIDASEGDTNTEAQYLLILMILAECRQFFFSPEEITSYLHLYLKLYTYNSRLLNSLRY